MAKAAGSSGRRRSLPARLLMLGLALAATCGCLNHRQHVKDNLMSDLHSHTRNEGVTNCYRVGCPDVLRLEVAGQPNFTGNFPIEPDGRIELADYGAVRVEGRPTTEIAQLVAEQLGAPQESVKVEVAEYNSEYLLLFGQVFGWQRAVPYRGQETVLDVLQRVGGITPAASPESVYVVRSHVIDGQRPEVFHVDLDAIVMKKDYRSNIRVQPYDQIYVGETRRARLEKSIPLWLMPAYRTLTGVSTPSTPPAPIGEAARRLSAWRRYLNGSGDTKPPARGVGL